MEQINFSTNPHGKLFLDIFSDVRLPDAKFYPGNRLELVLKNQHIGYVTILAVKCFSYQRIGDTLSYLNVGKAAPYQAALLKRYYPHINFEPDTQLVNIVFKYTERNIQYQQSLMEEWWKEVIQQQTLKM